MSQTAPDLPKSAPETEPVLATIDLGHQVVQDHGTPSPPVLSCCERVKQWCSKCGPECEALVIQSGKSLATDLLAGSSKEEIIAHELKIIGDALK